MDKKKKNSGLVIAVIVVLLVLLVGAYFMFGKKSTETSTDASSTSATDSQTGKTSASGKTYEEIQAEIREVNDQAMNGEISQAEARDRLQKLQQEALQLQLQDK